MTTSAAKPRADAVAVDAQIDTNFLRITLSDGRELSVPYRRVPWLAWLADATDNQRQHCVIEPTGFAVYWPDLDDGVEVSHLLVPQSLV